jgi:hypothetical protein
MYRSGRTSTGGSREAPAIQTSRRDYPSQDRPRQGTADACRHACTCHSFGRAVGPRSRASDESQAKDNQTIDPVRDPLVEAVNESQTT